MRSKKSALLMLTVLTSSMLTMGFSLDSATANNGPSGITDQLKTEETGLESTGSTISDSETDFSANNSISGASTYLPSEQDSRSSSLDVDKWNSNKTNEWAELANAEGDSIELVIGVNFGKPNYYVELAGLINEFGGELINTVSMDGTITAVVADIPLVKSSSFTTGVQAANLLRYIEPNFRFQANLAPNDPFWPSQWGPLTIEADYAWNTTIGNQSVLVAVVDTGIDWNHPDLAANYVPFGYDWVNNDTDPMDDNGHGSHVAGIIAAVINNSIGIAGLAQVRIMAEKGLDYWGWGYEDDLANSIIHAADQGANIISNSWGGYGESELIYEAVKYAYEKGALVIASAGNDAVDFRPIPAGYDEVIAVTATDQGDNPAWFTNYGDWVELAAPGVSIYSTVWDDSYTYMSGTSMSAPHVSGVAALIWSQFPNMTRDQVRLQLRYTADDLGDSGFDDFYGYGRVNARTAVERSPPAHDLLVLSWDRPPYVEPGETETVGATVFNFGTSDESNITVHLLANGSIVDSATIDFLAGGSFEVANTSWTPLVEGVYNVTLYVVPKTNETMIENNIAWAYVYVGFPRVAMVLDSAGTDLIVSAWQVLNTNWMSFGDEMIYIDYETLNKDDITYEDIASTNADVLIISCAFDWEFTDLEIEAIGRYVREGHGLIATAGTFYYWVPNNNKLAPLFGMNETVSWTVIGTDLLHLLEPAHPLFFNVPNPYTMAYVPTAVPSDRVWDSGELVGGEYVGLGHFRESAIVVHRGLVYLSPWLEAIPSYYRFNLQLLYNAIVWSRYERPEHELVASVAAQKRLEPGEHTLLNATVSNLGLNNETDVELQLLIDGVVVDNATVFMLPVDDSITISYSWTPTLEGAYNITAYASPVPEEEFMDNNIAQKTVVVLLIPVRNVLVYSDDYAVAPSSRYPVVALDNLEINYTHYADDPWGFGVALVSQPWDLVVVDHSNYYALGDYWSELESYVRGGGLLVLSTFDVDGSHSEATTLWDTLGVQWASDMLHPEPVYRWIPSHPLFTFPNTLGDLTFYTERYWDNGDHVSATTGTPVAGFTTSPIEDYAGVVVGNEYQTVLFSFLLSEFLYDQDADGKLDSVELWENAIIHVVKPPEHELVVTLEAPSFLEPGNTVMLNATVRNRGANDEANVELFLMINGTTVRNVTVGLLKAGDSFSLPSYPWTPTVEGTFNVTVYVPPVPDESVLTNNFATKIVDVRVVPDILVVDDNDGDHYWANRTSLPEFESALMAGGYDYWIWDESSMGNPPLDFLKMFSLVIWTCGDYWKWAVDPVDAVTLESYLAQGGSILLEGNNIGYDHDGDSFMRNVAHAIYQTDGTGAPGLTVTDPTHPVTQGLPVSFTWLVEPIYEDGVLPTNGGFEVIRYTGTFWTAVTVFEGVETGSVVYYSFSLYSLAQSEGETLTINSVRWLLPQQHDLAVSLEAPSYLEPGDSVLLNATVSNVGLSNETDVQVFLLINGSAVKNETVSELVEGASHTMNYLWTPFAEGTYNITAHSGPVPEELVTADNSATKMIRVRWIKGYVLFDQTHGTDDLSNYNSWVANLTDGGYVVDTLTTSPIMAAALDGYDVFVVPQAHYNYSSDELTAIQGFVAEGGGLLVIGDDDPAIYTDLTGFAGIGWMSGGTPGTTTDITSHMITEGVASVYLSSPVAQMETTGEAVGLVRDVARGIMLSVSEHILGNVIGFADENSLWDYALGREDNLRLANNMIDWLVTAKRYEHELTVELTAPPYIVPRMSVILRATVRNLGLNNETNVTLTLLINGSLVRSYTIPELTVGSYYSTSYLWTPHIEGPYNITAYAPPVPDEVVLSNNVETKTVSVLSTADIYVFANPPISTVLPNETLTIDIEVVHVNDLYAWQIRLYFDPSTLNFTGAWLPPNHVFADQAFIETKPRLDVDLYGTYITIGASLMGIQAGFNGSGTLCRIEFQALDFGVGDLEFSRPIPDDTVLLDSDLEDIPFTAIDGLVKVLPYHEIVHDIGIADVELSATDVYAGQIIDIIVTVLNEGDIEETFNLTLYGNATHIETKNVTLPSLSMDAVEFVWNTTGSVEGNYTIVAVAEVVPDETDALDNTYIDGTVHVRTALRDVALISINLSDIDVYVGEVVDVAVVVVNEGEVTESFDVTVYYNISAEAVVETRAVSGLLPNESRTLVFYWNTSDVKPCNNYVITAVASAVLFETDTNDNTVSSVDSVKVRLLGDLNRDGTVDIRDIVVVAVAFGSDPTHPSWNPEADLNDDGVIDIRDIAMVARNFGTCVS